MRRSKKVGRALLFVTVLFASLMASGGTASAASDYDGAYRKTDTITLGNDGWPGGYTACASVDYTASWASAMLSAPQMTTAYRESFNKALEDGRRGVSGVTTTSYGHTVEGFIVYWTEDTSLQLNWTAAYDGHIVTASGGSSFHSVLIRNHNAQTTGSDCSPYAVLAGSSMVSTSTDVIGSFEDVLNLFISTEHPNYPTGYEGESVFAEAPMAKYVAMGDSFSSGEGASPFEIGTDTGGVDECHRSPLAYPRLAQGDLSLGLTAFVACAGATTANILSGQWNELAQIGALSGNTEKVTLTIGGNDVAFSSYLLGCVVLCGPGTPIYDAMIAGINQPAFRALLEYTYEKILQKATTAQIYVADYPYLSAPSVTTCWGLDFSGAYEVQTALNEVIRNAVENVGMSNPRIHYVATNYSNSPFTGGELCGGNGAPLFNGVMLPGEYSLHPNALGQRAYATVFEEVMA